MFDRLSTELWFCPDCGGEMQYEDHGLWWCVECGQEQTNTADMLVYEEARQQFDSDGSCRLASQEDLDADEEECDELDDCED